MHIFSPGLNHTTAPVELREKLLLSEVAIRSALARLACGQFSSSIAEYAAVARTLFGLQECPVPDGAD